MIGLLMGMPPTPPTIPPRAIFAYTDYPDSALRAGHQGVVRFRAVIDPSGRIAHCDIVLSSGFEDLDDLTCLLVKKRIKASPARGSDGAATYSTLSSGATWLLPGLRFEFPPAKQADLQLTVNKLPAGVTNRPAMRFVIEVDPEGKILACAKDPLSPANSLAAVACPQLAKLYKPTPALTAEGEPVRSVQTATVSFQTGP